MTVDTDGRIYMATTLGIQVFDQIGKCHGILRAAGRGPRRPPSPSAARSQPPGRACSGGKIYTRKIKATGAPSLDAPITPTAPRCEAHRRWRMSAGRRAVPQAR